MGIFSRIAQRVKQAVSKAGQAIAERRQARAEKRAEKAAEKLWQDTKKKQEKEKKQREKAEKAEKAANEKKKREQYDKSRDTFKKRWSFKDKEYDQFLQFTNSIPREMIEQFGSEQLVEFFRGGKSLNMSPEELKDMVIKVYNESDSVTQEDLIDRLYEELQNIND